jgi:hypothetical protein
MPEPESDFYVGYLPKSPPRLARHTIVVVIVHLALSMAAATLIVMSMRDPGRGVWDDATPRTFEGELRKEPYPLLVDSAGHTVLIVDFGKHGAQQRLAGVEDGQQIAIRGYPLVRDGRSMVELSPEFDAITPGQAIHAARSAAAGGRATLRGEIVDSKCFLGAMKPGDGKTHKACATRCISGGIPPMLVCWDHGRTVYYLLSDARGEPLDDWFLPFIGESVELTGQTSRIGDLPVFRVDDRRISTR